MLIKSWKKTTTVEEIVKRRKQEIYEEYSFKKEQLKNTELLKKNISANLLGHPGNTQAADDLLNDVKEVLDKHNATSNSTVLSAVLVYLWEMLTC